jgi:tRNA (adenine22-N1)-methyltransferase
MSDSDRLRHWAEDNGWAIVKEDLAEEGGRLYELLHLSPQPGWTYPGSCWEVGDDLVRQNHPLLPKLLEERCAKYRHLLEQMDKSPRARASERYQTYETILEQLEALENGRK